MSDDRRSTEHTPLSDAVFHILLALVDEPRHGYGILLDVERGTGGAMVLGTGTLYSAIKRLREGGLVSEAPAPAADEDPRRRYYALTDLGRSVVEAEAQRLEGVVAFARRKLPAQ